MNSNRKLMGFVLAAAVAVAGALPLTASAQTDALNNSDVNSYWILGPSGQVVAATEVPGGQAQKVIIPSAGGIWEDSAHSGVNAALKKGDQLLVTVWLKAEGAQGKPGHVNVKLEENDAPYNAVGQQEFSPNGTWTPYSFNVAVKQNYPVGSVSLVLQYGDMPQTVFVGPMTVAQGGDSLPH